MKFFFVTNKKSVSNYQKIETQETHVSIKSLERLLNTKILSRVVLIEICLKSEKLDSSFV